LGFALMLVGISGGLRPAAAVATFQVREPLLLAPAGVALVLALVSLIAAKRNEMKTYRRLALAALLFSVSDVLTSAAPEARFGGVINEFSALAHLLKFGAFLFLAGWLWTAVASSIRVRFVASFGALLVGVILTLSTALTGVISGNVQGQELSRIQAQVRNAAERIEGEQTDALAENASSIAGLKDVREDIVDRISAPGLAARIFDSQLFPELDFVITDPVKFVPAGAGHGPYLEKDRPERLTKADLLGIVGSRVVTEVRDGKPRAASLVRLPSLGKAGDYVAIIAASEVVVDGRPVGLVVVGEFIDALDIEGISEAVGGSEETPASLIVGKKVLASELPTPSAKVLTVPGEVRTLLRLEGDASVQQEIDASSYFSGFAQLTDADDNEIGTLVISSVATVVQSTRESVTRTLFITAMLVGVVALALAYLSGRRITRPIQALTATAGAIREGDLSAQAEVSGLDEVGRLGETFNEMTSSLFRLTADLRASARQEHDLRERIETIIESMADGLVAVDADKCVLAFNREAENLTGLSSSEALGRPVEEVLRFRDAQGEERDLPIHHLDQGSSGGVFLVKRGDDPIPVAVTSAVLRGEDESVSGAVAVIRDMTREREVERMKTEFLSNISHELRTPLTPIKGYAQILSKKEVAPDKVRQFSSGILESTARLERIVELLVDFSAMEAGRMAPKSSQVDMAQVLRSLVSEWEKRAKNHEIVADVAVEDLQVVGDGRLLKRSIEEIIDNAVKFSPEGGTIKLGGCLVAGGNGVRSGTFVQVTVADEGIGISPKDLPKIFSDFHQLDGSETRSYGGLGLGLAFVQRIVEAHSGVIEVESEVDGGTCLTITLPAVGSAGN
ncbi:MAG: ATP-binding protein, partial [Actinomycetota bacterium]